MTPTAIIREYTSKDKESILELFRMNTPTYFALEEENDLAYYLENEIEYYYIIELEEKIVGSGGINFSEDKVIGKISWDLMHSDYQGKGLGTLLLKFRINKLKEDKEVQQIIVRTSQQAYKFYEKSGFILIEVVKDYWANGFDLFHMQYSRK
jgi:ribosomal-protein-alanine N-acetyltransferase